MKRTDIQIGKLLLNELKLKVKLANLSPDKSYKFLTDFRKPLDTLNYAEKKIKDGQEMTDWLARNFDEEVKKMVDVYDYDKEGFLHIKVNPRIPRDLIFYLIDLGIDDYPKKITFHYHETKAKTPALKWKDFLDRYYPQFPYFPPLLSVNSTPPKIRKGRVITHKNRLRDERLKALEVWEAWLKSGLSAKKGFPEIAKKLGIPLSTVKTRWYKAHLLITGKPYDPQKTKRELGNKADELCSRCKDVKCYKEIKIGNVRSLEMIPCADYLKLAGKKSQREKPMTEKQFYYSHFGELPKRN